MKRDEPPPQLDYAPREHWQRRMGRRFAVIFLIIVVLAAFSWLAPVAWERAQLLYWQNRCLSYQSQPGQIAYATGNSTPTIIPEWLEFYRRMSQGGLVQSTLFLHERTSPSGNRRLVVVELPLPRRLLSGETKWLSINPSSRVLCIGTMTSWPAEAIVNPNTRSITLPDAATVFQGLIDPNDKSHFTIRAVSIENQLIIDGWLRDDDTVILEPRAISASPFSSTTTFIGN